MSIISDLVNGITGNLATDVTKWMARKVGKTTLARRLEQRLNPDQLHPVTQRLLEEAVTEGLHDLDGIDPTKWQPIFTHPENRLQLLDWVLTWQDTPEPDLGPWSLENAPNADMLRGFLQHLHQLIQAKKRKYFGADFFNLLGHELEILGKLTGMGQQLETALTGINTLLQLATAPSNPSHSVGRSQPQDHHQNVINAIASNLAALGEKRLPVIAQAMVELARGKTTGITLTSNTETLAAQTAVCMVDHLAVSEVVTYLIRLIRNMDRQDANRVADIIDYLLPLNYVPDVIKRLSAQIDKAGFGLVENEVITWTLAEIIMAGYEQKPALYKVLTDGSVRGQTAQDYDRGPVVGPGNMEPEISGLSYAVRDMLTHLLALLDATPQRKGSTDINREVEDYARRLRERLKAERPFNRDERSTYYVLTLPEQEAERAFLKRVLHDVGQRVPQLFFVELALYQKHDGESEMDSYIQRLVRTIREQEDETS